MLSKLVQTYARLKPKKNDLETMLNPKGRKTKQTMIWKLCSILKA